MWFIKEQYEIIKNNNLSVNIKNIDKEKYIVSGIYIDKYGCWYKVDFNKEYEFNIPESIIKLENIDY